MFSLPLKSSPVHTLETPLLVPDFSERAILGRGAGARPYRKGGIRLEPEYLGDRLILHNYGHGGSGVALSWGSVLLSLRTMETELSKGFAPSDIAVIGAGVIGLTTAHLLAEQGWRVQIYASHFSPHTTSDLAPALWNAVVVDGGDSAKERQRFEWIVRTSFEHFKGLAEARDPSLRGVTPLTIYSFKNDPAMANIPGGVIAKGAPIRVAFENGVKKMGRVYYSYTIDTKAYLGDLRDRAKERGVPFTRLALASKEQLKTLSQRIIFNCTGLGSKTLFDDDRLIPVQGELIYLKRRKGFDYMLSGRTRGALDTYLIPIEDRLVLGGSYHYGVESTESDLDVSSKILSNARRCFSGSRWRRWLRRGRAGLR